jgi:hypothetical protein
MGIPFKMDQKSPVGAGGGVAWGMAAAVKGGRRCCCKVRDCAKADDATSSPTSKIRTDWVLFFIIRSLFSLGVFCHNQGTPRPAWVRTGMPWFEGI